MQRARHEFLAGSALPPDQHRGIGLGQGQSLSHDLPHRRRFRHPGTGGPFSADFLAQHRHLAPQPGRLQGPEELGLQVAHIQGFLQIVIGALFHGPDTGVDGAICGHDNHRGAAVIQSPDLLHDLDAVHVRQHQVRQDHIRPSRPEGCHAGRTCRRQFHLAVQITDRLRERAPVIDIVFHNQNSGWVHVVPSAAGNSMRNCAPGPSESVTTRLPPFFSTAVRARNSPRPVP